MSAPRRGDDSFLAPYITLAAAQRAFADRLFLTGGRDPGDAALALPPERIELYRELCRGNYRGMLRFAYTQAFELMDREIAADGAGLPDDTDAVIARFLEVWPSRTHSSREIADRFMVFLPREFPDFAKRRADLPDLMRLERAELAATFAPDDPGRCLTPSDVDTLAAGALDDLLALTLMRAPSASVLRLAHTVVALRAALEHGEPTPPACASEEGATVSRSAPPRFALEFAVHADAALRVFETAVPGVPVGAEALAADWIAALAPADAARDDEWKAAAFATAVVAGLRAGVFRVV